MWQSHSIVVALLLCDIALYPSIWRNDGFDLVREGLHKCKGPKFPVSDIMHVEELVLKNNIFEFDGNTKQQTSGIANWDLNVSARKGSLVSD